MTGKVIATFSKGDEVPEWLFAPDPVTKGIQKPLVYFLINCHVVETVDAFWLIPATRDDARGFAIRMDFPEKSSGFINPGQSKTLMIVTGWYGAGRGDDGWDRDFTDPEPVAPILGVDA